MSLPNQRVTITPAEYQLLKPGLDILACGLADAKLGLFPRRHRLHLIDYDASSKIYRNQQFAPDMAERIIAIRAKLWNLSQSRKLRFDVIDFAALQFAARLLRLARSERLDEKTKLAVENLIEKLEVYRRRAKRATDKTLGESEYQAVQQRWEKSVAWCRYNLLQFKGPKLGQPFLARLWREQREQLAAAVVAALAKNYFEALPPEELTRIVELLKPSLRRGRHPVTLKQLLKAPEQHFDLLLSFVQKRTQLTRTPGAPLPAWEAAMLRAEKLAAYQNRFRNQSAALAVRAEAARPQPQTEHNADSASSDRQRRIEEILNRTQPRISVQGGTGPLPNSRTKLSVGSAVGPAQNAAPIEQRSDRVLEPDRAPIPVAQTAAPPVSTAYRPAPASAAAQTRHLISDQELWDGLATWFVTEVDWRYALDVVREARSLVERSVHQSCRKPTSATTVPEILKELRPVGAVEYYNVLPSYVSILLGCLLAVRSDPGAIYDGITHGYARAKVIKEGKL